MIRFHKAFQYLMFKVLCESIITIRLNLSTNGSNIKNRFSPIPYPPTNRRASTHHTLAGPEIITRGISKDVADRGELWAS